MIPSFRVLCSNINKLAKPCEKYLNSQPLSTLPNSIYSDEHLKSVGNKHGVGLNHGNAANHKLRNQLIKNAQRGFGSSSRSSTKDLVKDEMREFKAIFPDIVRDVTVLDSIDAPDATKWFSRVLQYNLLGGKMTRAFALLLGYKMLSKPEDHTPDNIRRVQIMGWCLEMYQSFFLVLDDMVDDSESRRGNLCWYKNPDVGLAAINDGIFIESGLYTLLRKHFSDQPYFVDAINIFHDMTHKTIMGQCLDHLTGQNIPKYKLDKFTMDHYNTIIKLKCAYSFPSAIALAMYMVNIRDPEKHRQAEIVLTEMGSIFQIQDDYIDCFGDPAETGKIGTDIQDGKCSWIAVVALQRCSKEQRAIMEECYGSKDIGKIARVKELYNELSLAAVYKAYEEESYNRIKTHIQQMSSKLNHELFFKILDLIYKRDN